MTLIIVHDLSYGKKVFSKETIEVYSVTLHKKVVYARWNLATYLE